MEPRGGPEKDASYGFRCLVWLQKHRQLRQRYVSVSSVSRKASPARDSARAEGPRVLLFPWMEESQTGLRSRQQTQAGQRSAPARNAKGATTRAEKIFLLFSTHESGPLFGGCHRVPAPDVRRGQVDWEKAERKQRLPGLLPCPSTRKNKRNSKKKKKSSIQ